MARRREKKDLLTSPYTPERQLEQPSGWCMTKDHNGCRYQFDHGKCGCKCHTDKMKQEVVSISDSDDPRPWKVEE
jgi:hypothetical protein